MRNLVANALDSFKDFTSLQPNSVDVRVILDHVGDGLEMHRVAAEQSSNPQVTVYFRSRKQRPSLALTLETFFRCVEQIPFYKRSAQISTFEFPQDDFEAYLD